MSYSSKLYIGIRISLFCVVYKCVTIFYMHDLNGALFFKNSFFQALRRLFLVEGAIFFKIGHLLRRLKQLHLEKDRFYIWVFSHEHSRFTRKQGKGEALSLLPLSHFHPLHRPFDISRTITAERWPLHIARNRYS